MLLRHTEARRITEKAENTDALTEDKTDRKFNKNGDAGGSEVSS